jgi:hypothetical protein
MSDTRSATTDPRLLLEAARVFNAAGRDYRTAAEVVAELALQARDNAEPQVRQAIIGDAAALRLSRRVPGGYQAALELLEPIGDAEEEDHEGRLHLLRALANGQKYKDATEARDQLRDKIIADLRIALSRNPRLRRALPHFWQPPSLGEDPEDDLRAVYLDNPKPFEELINPLSAGQTGPTGTEGAGAAADQTVRASGQTGAAGSETGVAGGEAGATGATGGQSG